MLICLFTAFLFFVVRMPANDQRRRNSHSHSHKAEPALKSIRTITVKQPLLQFDSNTEDRKAA